jgi:hypothetical protein
MAKEDTLPKLLLRNYEKWGSKQVAMRKKELLCFNGSRTASFRKKCDTSSRRRYNKTKPGGVMTWIEIKADA